MTYKEKKEALDILDARIKAHEDEFNKLHTWCKKESTLNYMKNSLSTKINQLLKEKETLIESFSNKNNNDGK